MPRFIIRICLNKGASALGAALRRLAKRRKVIRNALIREAVHDLIVKESHSKEWSAAVREWEGDASFEAFELHRSELLEPTQDPFNPARARKIEPMIRVLLQDLEVLSFEREDAKATAAVRAALRKRDTPIGSYDVMIAGTALRRGLVMVTSNTDEFERVDGLLLEDWRTT